MKTAGICTKIRGASFRIALATMAVFTAHAAKLPTGYTECTWISVTNKAQYIDTGYLPQLTTDIQAHFEVPDFASQNVLYDPKGITTTSRCFQARAAV